MAETNMTKNQEQFLQIFRSVIHYFIIPGIAGLIFFKGVLPLMFESNPGSEAPYWVALMFVITMSGTLIGTLIYTQYFKKYEGDKK